MKEGIEMKRLILGMLLVVVGIFAMPLALLAEGCSPAANAVVKDVAAEVLDIAIAKCLAANPDKTKAELKDLCKWADGKEDAIVDLFMAEQKKGLAAHDEKTKAATPAPKCADAGAPAPAMPADAGKG